MHTRLRNTSEGSKDTYKNAPKGIIRRYREKKSKLTVILDGFQLLNKLIEFLLKEVWLPWIILIMKV